MTELHDRHTAVNLKDELYHALDRFGIDIAQIYSVTVDNGRNMVKMVNLVEKDALEDFDFFLENSVDEDIQKLPENELSENEDEQIQEYDDNIECVLNDLHGIINGHQVVCIRCGAHTAQLVVSDVCKEQIYREQIRAITKLVTTFRNAKYKNFFEVSGGKYPPIPVPTRWNSNFMMNQSLLENKDFFEKLGHEYKELDLTPYWNFIESFVEAFEPLYDCTQVIQKERCTLSDFYGYWMAAFGRVASLENNIFRTAILESMECREKALFDNYAFQASVYMDPRFSFYGSMIFSSSQKDRIVEYLLAVYTKISKNSQSAVEQSTSSPTKETLPSTSQGKFSLNSYLSSRLGEGSVTVPKTNTLEMRLRNLQYQPRVDADIQDFSIVQYWAQKRFEDPEIWKLAKVVFGAAATQCTVERDFSQFNIVLTKPRNRIKDVNLENILKSRANKSMIQKALPVALEN